MVTERQPWSDQAAAWLPGLVERGIPTLGICYGHQLLAHTLGGEVGDNPNGREFGTISVELMAEAADDPLLGGLPTRLPVQVCHTQSALRLPAARGGWRTVTAKLTRHSPWVSPPGAYSFTRSSTPRSSRRTSSTTPNALRAEGQDPDTLIAGCHDTPASTTILRRFGQIVAARDPQ